MIALALIFTIVVSHTAAQQCQTVLNRCLDLFISSSSNHPTNATLLCRDFNTMVQCYRSGCPVNDLDVNKLRRDLAQGGFQCDIDSPQRTMVPVPVTETPWAATTANVSAPCQSSISSCTKVYVSAVLNSTTNSQTDNVAFCSVSYDFINCIASSCNTDYVISQIKQSFDDEMHRRGVTCFVLTAEFEADAGITLRGDLLFTLGTALVLLTTVLATLF